MKHIRFIIGIPLIFLLNIYEKYTSKWVYIWITIPQFYCMVYKNMDRIEAANYLKKCK